MKTTIAVFLTFLLMGCSGKTGMEEKELATQEFVNCNFHSAISSAETAIQYAKDDLNVIVPAYLIIGKSSEILGIESTAYDQIVELVPYNVPSVEDAEDTANDFVKQLARMVPEKVAACEGLQEV